MATRAACKWGWTLPERGELQAALDQGVDQGVAPAMSLLLWRGGAPHMQAAAGDADDETIFDLASLTKPLATAAMALDLAASGHLALDASLEEMLGHAVPPDKKAITLSQLLCHRAGFVAHQPYHTLLAKAPPPSRSALLKSMLMNEPLACEPGRQELYSDLGYMVLGLIIERQLNLRLDRVLARTYERLGVDGPGFLPLDAPLPVPLERIAPCGSLPGRAHIQGQVEDENAFALNGVAGHAGLFGTARQTAGVMHALAGCAQGQGPWPVELAGAMFAVQPGLAGGMRTLGFDTPEPAGGSAGNHPPAGLVGHLGFTGVSIWWHPQSNRGVVLLTNRVALGRGNDKIKNFRRRVHELAWPLLGVQ